MGGPGPNRPKPNMREKMKKDLGQNKGNGAKKKPPKKDKDTTP